MPCPLRTGFDYAESSQPSEARITLSDFASHSFYQFHKLRNSSICSQCCEISPAATQRPFLRDPELVEEHSCLVQAIQNIPIVASMQRSH